MLKNYDITHPNDVWATDITYVRLRGKGWVYVVGILDWYSRYIISHEVSISLEVDFCLDALNCALDQAKP